MPIFQPLQPQRQIPSPPLTRLRYTTATTTDRKQQITKTAHDSTLEMQIGEAKLTKTQAEKTLAESRKNLPNRCLLDTTDQKTEAPYLADSRSSPRDQDGDRRPHVGAHCRKTKRHPKTTNRGIANPRSITPSAFETQGKDALTFLTHAHSRKISSTQIALNGLLIFCRNSLPLPTTDSSFDRGR
jgi:hypothetical protein